MTLRAPKGQVVIPFTLKTQYLKKQLEMLFSNNC